MGNLSSPLNSYLNQQMAVDAVASVVESSEEDDEEEQQQAQQV
jgi:uncharacterized protein YeeX (DUF496 family)